MRAICWRSGHVFEPVRIGRSTGRNDTVSEAGQTDLCTHCQCKQCINVLFVNDLLLAMPLERNYEQKFRGGSLVDSSF